jgi:hypothetical protein
MYESKLLRRGHGGVVVMLARVIVVIDGRLWAPYVWQGQLNCVVEHRSVVVAWDVIRHIMYHQKSHK